MPIFGNNTIGTLFSSFTNGSYFGHSYIMPVNGFITSISAYVNTAGASADMSISVFSSDGGGEILNLLASGSGSGVVTVTPSWVTVNLSSPYLATAGVNYYLCYWVNDSYTVYYDSGSSPTILRQGSSVYPIWQNPNTHGTGYNIGSEFLSVYGTYTPLNSGFMTGIKSINGISSITF